jgi:hypothetical protein
MIPLWSCSTLAQREKPGRGRVRTYIYRGAACQARLPCKSGRYAAAAQPCAASTPEIAMGLLIVRHKVRNFATWKKAFTADAKARKAAGLTKPRVYRSVGDRNETVMIFNMKSAASVKKLAARTDVKSTMMAAGILDEPTVYMLDEAK